MRVLHGGQQLAQVGLHLRGRARRAVEQLAHVALLLAGRAQLAHLDLRAVARVDLVAPRAPAPRSPAGQVSGDLGDALADHRRDTAPLRSPSRSLSSSAAVAACARLALAHQEHLVDLLAIAELAHEHGRER